ncbi:hypothetical protein [uncultured Pontibacter sp.]|uniref:hypothetical protein n=1 Tax=uncultured Pontibacter sp. TaxID=453356 RepID=UPI00262FC2D6|nr:hypothetical protein [uncultured Pontibacter sp.]
MKKLIFFLALLLTVAAKAQDVSYGLTGRFGAYKTIVSSSESIGSNNQYRPGLQLEVGAWVKLKVAEKSSVQFYVLQAIERQSGGTIRAVDSYGNDIADLKTRYGNLSIGGAAVYLYQLNDRLCMGAGVGSRYNLAAIMVMQKVEYGVGYAVDSNDYYANTYHRKLKVFVPLEAQVKLSQRIQLVGQVQVPLSNRIAAAESAFKERDLGLTVGVNYTL